MGHASSSPTAAAIRIRVGLVDDDPHYRLVVASVLASSGRHEVVATAGTAEAARQWAAETRPDVALVDVGLPDQPGAQVAEELRAKFPGVLVIMVTGVREDMTVLDAIRAGAVGYVLKGADTAQLIEAIDDALAGGAPMSPAIARRVLVMMQETPVAAPAGDIAVLTEREREVLALVAEGESDKAVAAQLGLARSTVKNCLLSVYGKWRVKSRTAAAVKFVRAGGRDA